MKLEVRGNRATGILKLETSDWRHHLAVKVMRRGVEVASALVPCPDPPCHERFHFKLPVDYAMGPLTVLAQDSTGTHILQLREEPGVSPPASSRTGPPAARRTAPATRGKRKAAGEVVVSTPAKSPAAREGSRSTAKKAVSRTSRPRASTKTSARRKTTNRRRR